MRSTKFWEKQETVMYPDYEIEDAKIIKDRRATPGVLFLLLLLLFLLSLFLGLR